VGNHEDCADLLLNAGAYGSEGMMDIAALRIQSSFRGWQARRTLRALKNAKVVKEGRRTLSSPTPFVLLSPSSARLPFLRNAPRPTLVRL
jgi:hypothetical protein